MWDERYQGDDYVYGTEPNDFLRAQADQLPPGRILCLAEGEGRNAVFLAEQGFTVTAIDQSAVSSNPQPLSPMLQRTRPTVKPPSLTAKPSAVHARSSPGTPNHVRVDMVTIVTATSVPRGNEVYRGRNGFVQS